MSDQDTSSLQSPLGRAKGLGSAKTGVHHWWVQRLTAVFLVPLVIWLVVSVGHFTNTSHAEVAVWIGQPVNLVFLSVLLLTVYYHAALGCQVVIEDYIHTKLTKILVLMLTYFACFGLCIASLISLMLIAFQTSGV